MEIYDEAVKKKEWSLKLIKHHSSEVTLSAINSNTGGIICHLLVFYEDGEIIPLENAYNVLESNGYDPLQHNNQFNSNGEIMVKYKL